MNAKIQKWGNSLGLRIPRILLESLDIRENDPVELIEEPDGIRMKKISGGRHRSLEDRLIEFYRKPIDEIGRIDHETELDWGSPEGTEIW